MTVFWLRAFFSSIILQNSKLMMFLAVPSVLMLPMPLPAIRFLMCWNSMTRSFGGRSAPYRMDSA